MLCLKSKTLKLNVGNRFHFCPNFNVTIHVSIACKAICVECDSNILRKFQQTQNSACHVFQYWRSCSKCFKKQEKHEAIKKKVCLSCTDSCTHRHTFIKWCFLLWISCSETYRENWQSSVFYIRHMLGTVMHGTAWSEFDVVFFTLDCIPGCVVHVSGVGMRSAAKRRTEHLFKMNPSNLRTAGPKRFFHLSSHIY